MSDEKQTTTSLDLDENLTPEDLARADLYGLLALLFGVVKKNRPIWAGY